MRSSLLTASLCLGGLLCSTAAAQLSTPSGKHPAAKALQPLPIPSGTSSLVGGSDDCSTAAASNAISGNGTFAVDSTAATTGTPVAGCGVIGTDVWFYWTATNTGIATVSLCGGTSADTALALWADNNGGACPSGSALACNDDSCGLQSQLTASVTAGSTYFIEVGSFGHGPGYLGTLAINVAGPPTGDDCSAPIAISGTGAFPFSNAGATAGTQGQSEALCLFFGFTAIDKDIWFDWTAPSTGLATVVLCGGTSMDSKLAAYSGAGCPAGAAIACNDDTCSLQSQISFACAAGQVYALQLGNYSGATAGSGTFTITVVTPDDCTTPIPISGTGTFPVDTTTATTGTPVASCSLLGADVWYRWTAPATGTATVATCGGISADSVIAAWDAAGVPPGACPTTQIACNDDSCGLQSQISFGVTAGSEYFLELGGYLSAAYAGTFTISVLGPPTGCQYDDGVSENSVGLTAGGDLVWLQKFGFGGSTTVVSSVSVAYGTAQFPGSGGTNGTPTTVAVWDDPNDDGLPNDLVLIAVEPTGIQNVDTDVLNVTPLATPVVVTGVYFVGAFITHPAGTFPASLDQTNPSLGRAWVAGGGPGTVNLGNLGAASLPPTDLAAIGLNGVWLLRADCNAATGTTICEGLPGACPCGNAGAPGHGCGNSAHAGGAALAATGSATIATDSLVLVATGMPSPAIPPSFCTFFQGTSLVPPTPFGDGLQCVGGALIRLATRPVYVGAAAFGAGVGTDPPVHVAGGVNVPGVRHYQVLYRNAAPFCTPATFNLTNGVTISWN